VLNAAQGRKFTQIDTNQEYYDDLGIKYFGCKLMDLASARIDQYIDEAVEFIHQAIDVKKGKVLLKFSFECFFFVIIIFFLIGKILIHCYMGVSRSATFMLAYMIKYKHLTLEEAIRLASEKRYIAPNDGFLYKLIEYEKNNLVQTD
jgi:protein-tyrosine phosphatase